MKNARTKKECFGNISDWVIWNYTATGPDKLIAESNSVRPSTFPWYNPIIEVYVKIKDGYSFETMEESQQFLKSLGTRKDGVTIYPFFPKSFIRSTIYWQSGQELCYLYRPSYNDLVSVTRFYCDNPIVNAMAYRFYCDYSRPNLIKLLKRLNNVSTTKTLILGNKLLSRLTTDDIKIATDKGWTLA